MLLADLLKFRLEWWLQEITFHFLYDCRSVARCAYDNVGGLL